MKSMEKELLDALDELKKAMETDSRVKTLETLEKKIMIDPNVILLSKKKDAAEIAYEEILAYHQEKDPEAQKKEKELYLAKKELDENPLVQQYNAAYIVVRDLYMAIDDILYKDFRKRSFQDPLEE